MGRLTRESIKEAAVKVLLKVVEAHHLSERIAETLANTVEFNLWKKILIGKSSDDVHINFRLTFKGVKPEEIAEDGEINVTLYEMVDGRVVTELFSQSLLKALMKADSEKIDQTTIDDSEVLDVGVDPAEPGKDKTVVSIKSTKAVDKVGASVEVTGQLTKVVKEGKVKLDILSDTLSDTVKAGKKAAKEGKKLREKYSKVEVKIKGEEEEE